MALTEKLQILISANAGNAVAEFKKVGAATQSIGNDTTKATAGLGKLGQAGAAAGGMLKAGLAGGITAAWAAIAAFGVSAVRTVVELDAAILKFQRASGATAEEASALIAAFDDMGIEADTGSKAIFQLGKRLETTKAALAGFGIVAVKNKQGNTDLASTLKSVADAYVNTADPAKRAALLTAAFGKSGQDMIPILEKGRAGIDALYASAAATGQIRTPEQVAQTEALRVAMDDLSDAGTEFSIMAGTALIPALTGLANVTTGAIEKVQGLADALGGSGIGSTILEGLGEALDLVGLGGASAADGLGAAIRAENDAAEAAATATKEYDALTKALFSAEDASRGVATAEEALSDANTTLVKATADYNKLLKDGAVDEQKVADARQSLASATRSVIGAQRDQAKAQREYNEAKADADFLGTDTAIEAAADAADGLADANDSVASAQESAAKAARDLTTAQAGDPEFQTKLAAAKESVSDATTSVADATYALGRASYENAAAQKAEAEAVGEHADQVVRLRGELEALLKLNPEQQAFVSPILGALDPGPGDRSPVLANATGGGLLGAPPSVVGGSGGVVNNNLTINTPVGADARLIAKEVMWNLN